MAKTFSITLKIGDKDWGWTTSKPKPSKEDVKEAVLRLIEEHFKK